VAQHFKAVAAAGLSKPPGVVVRLVEAGHILGSAAVVLTSRTAGWKEEAAAVVLGRIGRRNLPLIRINPA
jgi:Cft2 family RNA processing exonuclease